MFWLGTLQKRQGNYTEAADLYQQAARLDPMSPGVWTELAVVHLALGQFSEAAEFSAREMSVAPGMGRGYNRRFDALVLNGDTAAARSHVATNAEALEVSFYWPRLYLDHYLRREMVALADSLDRRRPRGRPNLVWVARVNWLGGREARVAVLADSIKTRARERLSNLEGQGLPLREAAALNDLALAEALSGNSRAANEAIRRALELSDGVDAMEYEVTRLADARIHVILGDADAAVESLEAYLQDSFEYLSPALLRLDPFWDSLRDNPRFQALLELERPGQVRP